MGGPAGRSCLTLLNNRGRFALAGGAVVRASACTPRGRGFGPGPGRGVCRQQPIRASLCSLPPPPPTPVPSTLPTIRGQNPQLRVKKHTRNRFGARLPHPSPVGLTQALTPRPPCPPLLLRTRSSRVRGECGTRRSPLRLPSVSLEGKLRQVHPRTRDSAGSAAPGGSGSDRRGPSARLSHSDEARAAGVG